VKQCILPINLFWLILIKHYLPCGWILFSRLKVAQYECPRWAELSSRVSSL